MFKDKSVLMLDLDETLIHSMDKEPDSNFEYDRTRNGIFICFRPHLFSFLLAARNRFEYIILWSCGEYEYVHEVIDILKKRTRDDMFDRVYTIKDAGQLMHKRNPFPFKDLYWLIDSLGFDKSYCIMLDDGLLIASFYHDIVHQVPKFMADSTNKYDAHLSDYKNMMTIDQSLLEFI